MNFRAMLRLSLAACLLCCAHVAAAAQARPDGGEQSTALTATREGRLRVFDEVWENINSRYYDSQMRGVDWRALRAEFRVQAAESNDDAEFYTVVRRMISYLHDPHTRVFAPGEGQDWRVTRFVAVGVSVRELGGELLVTSVERGSHADKAGVRAGDSVVSLDGEPVSLIIARRLAEQSSSTISVTARFIAVTKLFDGPRDSFVSVTFRGEAGGEKRVRLRRELHARSPALHVRREGGHIGVVQFNIFTEEIAAEFLRALKEDLKDAHGLVVDLRENGGGEAEAMADIASSFLPVGESLGQFTDRGGRVQLEPHTRSLPVSTAAMLTSFRGPVVVLTSAKTASASEVFVAALKEENRAIIVGENTCGCVLGIRRRHALPDGGLLDISEMDYHTTRGVRLEGAGVRPDEQVSPTRRDLQTGRDAALNRAIEILKRRNRK